MNPLKILFAGSEVWPLAKTGGLADVAYALPRALQDMGADVRVVIPAYRGTLDRLVERRPLMRLEIRAQGFTLWEGRLPGQDLKLWLVDYPGLFAREGDPYHDAHGQPWGDNAWRFGCFSEAVARLALGAAGWKPDVLHANDWQTGLAPAWLSVEPQRPRTVFTIHNLAFQGIFGAEQFEYLGLPKALWRPEAVEWYGAMSFMKGGINCSDFITTVSPTYAREIQTPAFGCGLEGLLRDRRDRLSGILNGVDEDAWNPATDTHLAQRYTLDTLVEGKRTNREAVQRELGLAPDAAPALIGMVGRLAYQKGSDLVIEAMDELMQLPVQLAVLASGDRGQEQALREAAARYPGRVGVRIAYDEGIAHRIEAGSDLFLMPSRFEPCGLNQMYSQRYGTVPLVHATGGLADTVIDASHENLRSGRATGICFLHPDRGGVLYAVRRALELRADAGIWQALRRAGMARSFSWRQAAEAYLELYRRG